MAGVDEVIAVRAASREDLPAVEAIQRNAPEAAQWPPADYLGYQFRVAEVDGTPAGFAVYRAVDDSVWELLNLAVDPAFRRRGVATALIRDLPGGRIFIEVRASNLPAQALYRRAGFIVISRRRNYYETPREDGIVMELQKC